MDSGSEKSHKKNPVGPESKNIFWSKGEIALSKNIDWGLFGKISNYIIQKVTSFCNLQTKQKKLDGGERVYQK